MSLPPEVKGKAPTLTLCRNPVHVRSELSTVYCSALQTLQTFLAVVGLISFLFYGKKKKLEVFVLYLLADKSRVGTQACPDSWFTSFLFPSQAFLDNGNR